MYTFIYDARMYGYSWVNKNGEWAQEPRKNTQNWSKNTADQHKCLKRSVDDLLQSQMLFKTRYFEKFVVSGDSKQIVHVVWRLFEQTTQPHV